jgi:hypothetical protein
MRLSPLEIVNRMINTEEELKHFIKQNCIHAPGDCHLYGLVIHAYNYLRSKIEVEDRVGSYNNTSSNTNNMDIKSDKADNELPMSPVEPLDNEDRANNSTGPPSGANSPTSAAAQAHQATLSAQANLTAANMALAIFKNAPKPPPPPSPLSVSPQLKIKPDSDETIQIDSDGHQADAKDSDQIKQESTGTTQQQQQATPGMGAQSAFSMNLGPVNQALLQAQQNLLQHQYNQISQGGHGSINPYSTSSINQSSTSSQASKRSSINALVETTTGKRPRLDQPTIEVSLDNLTAIGKKEALMLTKEQIEMMLRISAPEVTLVQHIVRRPDLEKYWTYIRKINVNGHQTVWTQCTSK